MASTTKKMTSSFQDVFFEIINLSLSDVFGTFQSLFHCLTKNLDLCVVATKEVAPTFWSKEYSKLKESFVNVKKV